jgi:diguanylate cyclase (GGDEF)-like protein
MLAELGELDQHTGRFSDGMLRYAETVQNAQSLESLAEVVREMVAESRSVHGLVSATRGRLQDEHRRASELETQVRALEAELRRLSDEVATDALTQVANRRGLMQQFEVEQARIAREGTNLAIGLLDIDNFKRLNDTLGHSAGDEALKALAEHVRSSLRPVDAVARFGGEEFVVLLPGTPVDEAQQVLTRLQRQLSASLFMHENKEVFVTFSAGVTQYRAGESLEEALERADEASTRPSAPARTAPAWADRPAALRFSGCDRGRDGPPAGHARRPHGAQGRPPVPAPGLIQLGQDAAFATRQRLAASPQLPQLAGQCLQLGDALLHMADVGVQHRIGLAAVGGGVVAEAQQGPDLVLGHVQRTAAPDEGQSLHMGFAVDPVVAGAAWRGRQQALALVVADGFHRGARGGGEVSDLHRLTLHLLQGLQCGHGQATAYP